jgi:hypothetical protein
MNQQERENIIRLFNTSNPDNWVLAYELSKIFYPELSDKFKWVWDANVKVSWGEWGKGVDELSILLSGKKDYKTFKQHLKIRTHLFATLKETNK